MSDAEALQQALAEIISFNHALDISITGVSPERVELRQPEATNRLNAAGAAVEAVPALFMLGEAAAEAMAIHAFQHLFREEGIVPFVVKTTISFTDLVLHAHFINERLEAIAALVTKTWDSTLLAIGMIRACSIVDAHDLCSCCRYQSHASCTPWRMLTSGV